MWGGVRGLMAVLAGVLLSGALTTASAAQDEVLTDLVSDIDRAVVELEAELAAIDERIVDDDWMAFESASRGLVQVDLGEVRRWIPLVLALREGPDEATQPGAIGAAADVAPGLWTASVLLGDAPVSVLRAGPDATVAWLRDHFSDSQSPEQKRAVYEAHRARLLAELDALRTSHEVLSRELVGQEIAEVEAGPRTETPGGEVAAEEPVRCGEDTLEWTTDPSIGELRWNGVWEYYGVAGLTLNRVGDVVCATYGRGDGWMKLAIVEERTLIGHWYEGRHAETCDQTRDGTDHWGWVEFRFDDTFESYDGRLGVCDGPAVDVLQGSRAR